jgi:hypothetical protein
MHVSGQLHCPCRFIPVSRAPVTKWIVRSGFTLQQATRGQRGSRGRALLFHDLGTRWRWVVSVTPRPPLPPGKARYPFYRRLGGPQGRSGRVRKLSSPPGFDPRAVLTVASHYTDWAIPASKLNNKADEPPEKIWTFSKKQLLSLPAFGARSLRCPNA